MKRLLLTAYTILICLSAMAQQPDSIKIIRTNDLGQPDTSLGKLVYENPFKKDNYHKGRPISKV